MKTKKCLGYWGLLALTAILCVGVIIGGDTQYVGATENFAGTIIIGDDEEVTGAYASTTYCHAEAAQDYWKQHKYQMTVNGKIYKVKHMFVDNKTDVSISVSKYHQRPPMGISWTSARNHPSNF